MRDRGGTLTFAPRLPEGLTRLAFTIPLRQRRLAVHVAPQTATYTLLDGEPVPIAHHGQPITVALGDPTTCPIPPTPRATAAPTQPPGREPARRRLRADENTSPAGA